MGKFKLKRRLFSDTPTVWNRSEHMKLLHQQGRYAGTSKIGLWNVSDAKRQHMAEIYKRNALDKNSFGYGSEHYQRLANRTLLHNKFQGEQGYLYFLKFPKSIKVGFSKNWERRITHEILGGTVILIISGPTNDLADLEYDTFQEFQNYTQLDSTGTRYTEFLELSQKRKVYNFLMSRIRANHKLKIEISNPL